MVFIYFIFVTRLLPVTKYFVTHTKKHGKNIKKTLL